MANDGEGAWGGVNRGLQEHPPRGFNQQPTNASTGNIPSVADLPGSIPARPATLFPDPSRNATGRRGCASARTPAPSHPNLRRTPKTMPHPDQLPLFPSHISGDRSPAQAPPTDCQLSQSGGCAALASDTPVPTASGWTTLRRIKPKALVFDHTGEALSRNGGLPPCGGAVVPGELLRRI